MGRRWIHNFRIIQQIIQNCRRHPHGLLLRHTVNHIAEALDALLCQSRSKKHGDIRSKRKAVTYLPFQFHHGIRLFGNHIPLIHHKDKSFASLMDIPDNLFILFRKHIVRIKDKNRHIAIINCTNRTNNTVLFQRFVNLSFLTHPCRIYKNESLPFVFPYGIHSVTSSSHFISHKRTLIAEKRIDQRRFPYIRTPHDRRADDIGRIIFLTRRKSFRNLIQQITKSQMVHSGYRHGIADSQGIKLIRIHFLIFTVHFIHAEYHGLSRTPKHSRNRLIILLHTDTGIDDKKNHICLFHGKLRLLSDTVGYLIRFITELNTARVNHGKLTIQPAHVTVNTIPRHTGDIFNN